MSSKDTYGLDETFGSYLDNKLKDCDKASGDQVRAQVGRGCIGYTCAELGIPRVKNNQGEDQFSADGPPNLVANVCFKTRELAMAEQQRWNAEKKMSR
jgi:hypothetical protein